MAPPGTAVPSYDKTGFSLTSTISFGRGGGSLPDCVKDGCPIRKIRGPTASLLRAHRFPGCGYYGQTRESRQEQVQTKPQTIRWSGVRDSVRRLCAQSCHRSAKDGRRGVEVLVHDCGSPKNRYTFRRVTIAPSP